MPKTSYPNKEAVPADQIGAYKQDPNSDAWILTDYEDDHPLVVTKKSLEQTQITLKGQITDLQNQVTTANSKALPEGMVAVLPAVKELGETAQGSGLTKKEIPGLKTRADQAEAKLREKEEAETISSIADENEVNRIAFGEHVKANNLKFETKTEKVDDKDVITRFVVTTDGEGKEVKTSIAEYLKTKGSHIPKASAKAANDDADDADDETIDLIDQDPDERNNKPGNEFDTIRQEVKQRYSTPKTAGGSSFKDKFYNRGNAAE